MPRVVAASSYQPEVYLPCQILQLDEDQTVSWIRRRDSLVLTVDKLRLVDDARLELNQAPGDWTLALRQPAERDAGLYECQVSSVEPKLSRLVELRMVRAESSISNFSSLYVRPGDLINLTCSIEAPQATAYVYWYKNKEVAHFDNLRAAASADHHPSSSGRRARAAPPAGAARPRGRPEWAPGEGAARRQQPQPAPAPEEPEVQWSRSSSSLIIREAQLNDTANYTCLPSNAKPAHIRVVVVENGSGSQPEKRSLQADGAASLLDAPRTGWLKVRLLRNWLRSALIDFVEFGYSDTGAHAPGLAPPSLAALLVDILGDANVARLALTAAASLFILARG